MKPALAAATFALLASTAFAQEAAMPNNGEISQILADRIDRDGASIGIAVAVIENGETRFVSHGTLGRDDPAPINEFTPFEAGSITKVFTSLVLAQLALEGEIDLDAPITDYLPEGTAVPPSDKPITAFDLASHMSGLTGLPPEILSRGFDNPYSGYTDEQLLAWLREQQLARPVGEGFEYSNVGVALLGEIIEGVTSEPYAKTVEDEVLMPLGMESSRLALGAELPEGMAIGHDGSGDPVPYWDFDAVAPAGALVTTAADLIKFIAAASGATETELKPGFDKMLERVRPIGDSGSIGLGWFITPTGSGEIVWHNGRTGGFASFAGFERNSGNGVVVLSNMSTEQGINDIGMHLLDPSLPLREQPKAREVAEIDPTLLEGYVGDYVMAPGVVMTITTDDGRIYAQLTGQPALEIFPESETAFFYRAVEAQITFEVADGVAKSLTLFQNGRQLPAMRVE
ncbi:CubicO group peptidase, beta-lactamase class C family [Devosia lucknowensis]|uniref:CubicO group peptidase, beta-lactamase class C family n=1 Tax=Devosia lucknowensis TaxID=1096929 RepID=A0A1Y6G796_9HYPH|nr:serine hydrolase [Devosia lucknowensis]SMQ86052.1 CubicO group peptidase, beta-lactamase class C family [Devosia lucknowensis]